MTRGWKTPLLMALALILAGALAAETSLAARGGGGRGGSGKGGASGAHHGGKHHGGGRHGHGRPGIAFGAVVAPAYWPWWGFAPYYYPPVAMASPPQVEYIERSEQEEQMEQAQYWLYCEKAKAYFPYVAECADGWERVPATPPRQGGDQGPGVRDEKQATSNE